MCAPLGVALGELDASAVARPAPTNAATAQAVIA
jgi:hypothetical protein